MGNSSKVLIIDNDNDLVMEKTKLLEEDGLNVVTNSDARDALERLGEIKPDLIIIGTEIPMINGDLPLTLLLKATQAPILVVGHREELVYMLELGADRFISKPLDKTQFIATIHSMLRRYSDYSHKGNNNDRIKNYMNN